MATAGGNNMYFGDAMPTTGQFLTGLGISMATGGVLNGVVTKLSTPDANFWTGKIPRPAPMEYLPSPKPTGVQTEEVNAPETMKPYNSDFQDVSEVKLPEKLYHYATDNPENWSSLGKAPGSTQFLTSDGELNSVNARINLALDKTPKFRIEITTSDPNFNPKVQIYNEMLSSTIL
ncbi:MAG: hypothetical protein ACK5L7_06815 [Paludibacteraceae bacterium]